MTGPRSPRSFGRMRRASLLMTLAVLLLAPASEAPAATARSCGSVGFTEGTSDGAFAIRATGVSCRVARRVARASRSHGVEDPPDRYSARGFTCRGRYSDEGMPGVRYRCTRGSATVRFDRA